MWLVVCTEVDSHHVDASNRHYVTVAHGKSHGSTLTVSSSHHRRHHIILLSDITVGLVCKTESNNTHARIYNIGDHATAYPI